MEHVQERRVAESHLSRAAGPRRAGATEQVPVWRLNLLRAGYLLMVVGLAVAKWPLFFTGEQWGLAEGTVQCMLVTMSVLALVGLRYPLRMLPILLFEVAWKLTWLAALALPQWADGDMDAATSTQVESVLWVVIIVAVVPWGHVVARYVLAPSEPFTRRR